MGVCLAVPDSGVWRKFSLPRMSVRPEAQHIKKILRRPNISLSQGQKIYRTDRFDNL
jgi:hypothetical protein